MAQHASLICDLGAFSAGNAEIRALADGWLFVGLSSNKCSAG